MHMQLCCHRRHPRRHRHRHRSAAGTRIASQAVANRYSIVGVLSSYIPTFRRCRDVAPLLAPLSRPRAILASSVKVVVALARYLFEWARNQESRGTKPG